MSARAGPVDPLLEQRGEQFLLALEVPVEGALGESRPRHDLVHRRGLVAALGEHLRSAVQKLGAGLHRGSL